MDNSASESKGKSGELSKPPKQLSYKKYFVQVIEIGTCVEDFSVWPQEHSYTT
jgi:hypothetical protein